MVDVGKYTSPMDPVGMCIFSSSSAIRSIDEIQLSGPVERPGLMAFSSNIDIIMEDL